MGRPITSLLKGFKQGSDMARCEIPKQKCQPSGDECRFQTAGKKDKARGFPGGPVGKNPPAKVGDTGSIPGSGKIPWTRAWQPTAIFLPGESHGQRSLAAQSPQGLEESDMTQ